MSLLEATGISTAYGPSIVHRDVSIDVRQDEIVTILGPNGAGKTTLLRTIAGLLRPRAGRISFDGQDVTHLPAERMAGLGVVLVPEGRKIFASLTVQQNLQLGAYARADQARVRDDVALMERQFPILAEKREAKGGDLSGGQQQMLAIARGLMARPRVLLLDEPSLGLSPLMVKEIRRIIARIPEDFSAAVLLVEQNAALALAVAGRGYLMQNGQIATSGTIDQLRDMSLMRELYLGEGRSRRVDNSLKSVVPKSG